MTCGVIWKTGQKRIAIEGMQDIMWICLIHFRGYATHQYSSLFLFSDPFAVRRNMARTLNSKIMFDICCIASNNLQYFASPSKRTAGKVRSNSQTDNLWITLIRVKRSTKVPDVRPSPHSEKSWRTRTAGLTRSRMRRKKLTLTWRTEVVSMWMDWLLLLGMQHCHFFRTYPITKNPEYLPIGPIPIWFEHSFL